MFLRKVGQYPYRVSSARVGDLAVVVLTCPPKGFYVVDNAAPFSNVIVRPRDAISNVSYYGCNDVARENGDMCRPFITYDCFGFVNSDKDRR